MISTPLGNAGQATADASGNATISMGPSAVNESWSVSQHRVSNPGPNIPTLNVYKNFIAPAGFVANTTQALNNTSETAVDLGPSEQLFYVFAGCSPGTVCTVHITGSRNINV